MSSDARHTRWTSIGWIGLVLFLLTWIELAIPQARRLFARVLPIQVLGLLAVSAVLCILAGLRKNKWFLVPAVLALASVGLVLLSVFSE